MSLRTRKIPTGTPSMAQIPRREESPQAAVLVGLGVSLIASSGQRQRSRLLMGKPQAKVTKWGEVIAPTDGFE